MSDSAARDALSRLLQSHDSRRFKAELAGTAFHVPTTRPPCSEYPANAAHRGDSACARASQPASLAMDQPSAQTLAFCVLPRLHGSKVWHQTLYTEQVPIGGRQIHVHAHVNGGGPRQQAVVAVQGVDEHGSCVNGEG